jgi:ADP-ribosyl-[dinitrogen reductase] hydrolase
VSVTFSYDTMAPGQLALIKGHKAAYLYYASYGGVSGPLWAVEGQICRFTTRSDWQFRRARCRQVTPETVVLQLDDNDIVVLAVGEIGRYEHHLDTWSGSHSAGICFEFDDSDIALLPPLVDDRVHRPSLSNTDSDRYRWLTRPEINPAQDRALGALIGLALGDALGTTLEFSPRDSRPMVTDLVGGGPFRLEPGQWTDDTSMALCLAESILEQPNVDPDDLMRRFGAWWKGGHNSATGRCFDIGHATSSALQRYLKTDDPLAGSTDPNSAGNGSLMRLSPVAIRWHRDPDQAREAAMLQSRTTHGAAQAVEVCALFTDILVEAISGMPKERVLRSRTWQDDPAVAAIAGGSWRDKDRDEISSSGYVVHTLEAALWSVARSASFEEALVTAVNLADDADTVGAVTGQLAGALWGLSSAPSSWLDRLQWRARLEWLATELFEMDERV